MATPFTAAGVPFPPLLADAAEIALVNSCLRCVVHHSGLRSVLFFALLTLYIIMDMKQYCIYYKLKLIKVQTLSRGASFP